MSKLGYCSGCGEMMVAVSIWTERDFSETTGKAGYRIRKLRCITLKHFGNRFFNHFSEWHDTRLEVQQFPRIT